MRFRDSGTADLASGKASKAARATVPTNLLAVAVRKLDWVLSATSLDELRLPPGNRLETLRGDRAGQHSIRINDQYRICFIWANGEATEIEVVDYH